MAMAEPNVTPCTPNLEGSGPYGSKGGYTFSPTSSATSLIMTDILSLLPRVPRPHRQLPAAVTGNAVAAAKRRKQVGTPRAHPGATRDRELRAGHQCAVAAPRDRPVRCDFAVC